MNEIAHNMLLDNLGSLNQSFSKSGSQSPGSSEYVLCGLQDKTVFIVILKTLFALIFVLNRGPEAMVGKTAGIYTQIKPGAPNCWLGSRYFLSQALAIKKKKSAISLKNVFREAVKIVAFIKS